MSALLTQAPTTGYPPNVRFFTGRSELFMQCGSSWCRMTREDEAELHTGYDWANSEASVGVYVAHRPNGLVRIGWNLWKLNTNLRPSVIEQLKNRWRKREAANFSKSMLRAVDRRTYFSRAFAQFEIAPARLEEWKSELSAILSNPESYLGSLASLLPDPSIYFAEHIVQVESVERRTLIP